MYADERQAGLTITPPPLAQVGQGTQTVNAGIVPELYQHHAAAQRVQRERWEFTQVPGENSGA